MRVLQAMLVGFLQVEAEMYLHRDSSRDRNTAGLLAQAAHRITALERQLRSKKNTKRRK
jgi:hypothetical protein